MSSPVEQIKEKLSIVDIVGSYLKLEKSGANFKAKCPFHNEKSPSFYVSPDKNYYYCFGCGAKGDIFTFVQEFEGLDFRGALKLLADKAGVQLVFERSEVKDSRDRLYQIMEEATTFFQKKFGVNAEAKEYLSKRGLTDKTIADWRIGFAPEAWRELSDYLKRLGYSEMEMETAGLYKRNGETAYDRFRGRIIFPIFDSAGRPVAFSGRILKKDDTAAKYLNSPETPLFIKSEILYGFDRAKTAIRKFDYSVLVEGQMDLLMSHQAGFVNTVASSGTALTSEHLHILKRLSNRVIMAFDSDNAGMKASMRAWKLALAAGMEVKIAQIPEGFDPADLILKNKDEWKEVLKNTHHLVDFLLSKVKKTVTDERKLAIAVRDEILPFVALIESSMEKAHYVSRIAHETGIKEEAVYEDLKKVPKEDLKSTIEDSYTRSSVVVKKDTANVFARRDSINKRVCGLLYLIENKSPSADVAKLWDKIKAITSTEEYELYKNISPEEKNDVIFQAEVLYQDIKDLDKEAEILIEELEEESLKKKFDTLMKQLTYAENNKQEAEASEVLKQCNEVSKRLNELKQVKSKKK
ncbi:MAG: DNA primase [bacterium]